MKDKGWDNRGYKLLRASPIIIRKEMLNPTDKTIFLTGFIFRRLNIRKIKKPGTMVKNINDKAGFKIDISNIMDRSVNIKRKITVNIQFLTLKSFIILFIFNMKTSPKFFFYKFNL